MSDCLLEHIVHLFFLLIVCELLCSANWQVVAGDTWGKNIVSNLYQSWLMKRGGFVFPALPPTVREHIAMFLVEDVQHVWADNTPVAHVC